MSPRLLARAHHVGFAGTPAYGLFGTSRQFVISSTSGSAAVSAALITPLAQGDPERCAGLAALLAILPGVVYVLLGWRRTDFGSQFISTSVQIGFLFGLELTIIVGQVARLLGAAASDGPFFEQLVGLLRSLAQTNGWTIALWGCSLVALQMLSRPAPLIPTAIVVIGVAIVVTTSGSTRSLIFCNTGWMRDRLCDRLRDTQPPPQAVVFDLQMSSDLDIRGLDTLGKITDDLSDQGIELRLANVHGQTHEMLHRGALATTIDIYRDVNDALRPGAEIGQERG